MRLYLQPRNYDGRRSTFEAKPQILAEIVRAYVEAGEPVSSRAMALSHAEGLSPATMRKVMGELEDAGLLYQPHTSAGRVPTASAYRFFAQQVAAQGKLSEEDRKWIRSELDAATTPEEMTERAGHVLAAISHGLGIIVMPPLAQQRAGAHPLSALAGWARGGGVDFGRRRDARQDHAPGARIHAGGNWTTRRIT